MIANTHYGYVKKAGKLQFTYTGQYNQREDGVVELLTSGTLVFLNPAVIDIFCVGGGGGGISLPSQSSTTQLGFGAGGGGYTATRKAITVSGSHVITVGYGGEVGNSGGATSFGTLISANGGHSGSNTCDGGNGGSGGGAGVTARTDYGAGGSDGGNGEIGSASGSATANGGAGQGTTTREFGELTGKLYAGGGGGGRYISGSPVQSPGGSGGGGAGAWRGRYSGEAQPAGAGGANTGGGGGGGAIYARIGDTSAPPAKGGSGIVCFRPAK